MPPMDDVLDGAASSEALGKVFGADLAEAEVRYLMRAEWAVTAADIIWRRRKLGLRLTSGEIGTLDTFMAQLQPERDCAAYSECGLSYGDGLCLALTATTRQTCSPKHRSDLAALAGNGMRRSLQ